MKIPYKDYSLTGTGRGAAHTLGTDDKPGFGIASPIRLVQITGSFSATVKFEVSLDGTNWQDLITGITTTGAWEIPLGWPYFAPNCTAFSSGPISIRVSKLVEE